MNSVLHAFIHKKSWMNSGRRICRKYFLQNGLHACTTQLWNPLVSKSVLSKFRGGVIGITPFTSWLPREMILLRHIIRHVELGSYWGRFWTWWDIIKRVKLWRYMGWLWPKLWYILMWNSWYNITKSGWRCNGRPRHPQWNRIVWTRIDLWAVVYWNTPAKNFAFCSKLLDKNSYIRIPPHP